jgi:hypothetical protein
MKSRQFATIASFLLFLSLVPGAAHACDPQRASLNLAETALRAHKHGLASKYLETARRALKGVDDFHYDYVDAALKLDVMDQADEKAGTAIPPSPEFRVAIGKLKSLADQLATMDSTCVKSAGYYRIYNTLGAEYLNRASDKQAACFLLTLYNSPDMLPSTYVYYWALADDNLGVVYLFRENYALSRMFFETAKAKGSAQAAYELRKNKKLAVIVTSAPGPFLDRQKTACDPNSSNY